MSDKPPTPSEDFNLVIVTPDEVIFEDIVTRIIAPGSTMDLAILPNHTPLYAQLKKGSIEVKLKSEETKNFSIESGILRVKNNQATIIMGFETPEMLAW